MLPQWRWVVWAANAPVSVKRRGNCGRSASVRSNGLQGKWGEPSSPFVQGWSVTFLLQQFVVADAAAASERRIV